jgi:heme-degrading monooxygenase HmoA
MLPEPPYLAVIFSSVRTTEDDPGYEATAARMEELASREEGYLGLESYRSSDRSGVTISYWKDEASIAKWKANLEHLVAQKLGREKWYASWSIRVARVERSYASE